MVKIKRTIPKPEETLPSLKEQLQDIMKNFDFDQVLEYMSWNKSRREYDDDGKCINKHSWYMCTDNGYKLLSIDEIKHLAEDQLRDVIKRHEKYPKENYLYIRYGPFKSTYRCGILQLECVIEDWSCD